MFLYNCQREMCRVAAAKKEIIKRDKQKWTRERRVKEKNGGVPRHKGPLARFARGEISNCKM